MDPIGEIFFSRVSHSVPFSKKKDPRRGGGPIKTVDQYSAVPYLHYRTGRGAWYLSVSTE